MAASATPSPRHTWSAVPCENAAAAPCPRALHVCAVHKDSLYVFGGYDGLNRLNDFYEFNFATKQWSIVPASGTPPSPRDRHVAVVFGDAFYVFGGFDGNARVNDFIHYNFSTKRWSAVTNNAGLAPTPRHSHAAVVHGSSMYAFGGYDGSYRNDLYEFKFASGAWIAVAATGRVPRPRYRSSLAVHKNTCILFGGHDGSRHLNDVHVFDFVLRTWSTLATEGLAPIPRDSHVAIVQADAMYVFGGSSGTAMNDFFHLDLESKSWQQTQSNGPAPSQRFCHVGAVYDSSLIIFGGYDGGSRLNDFHQFRFGIDEQHEDIPPSSIISDLRTFVNNEDMSDVTFIVEGQPVFAHKILCARCSYFKALLTGNMMESRTREIPIEDVRRPIFLLMLEYVYTDEVTVSVDDAIELLVAADRYGLDRLKQLCERQLRQALSIANAAALFHVADLHNAAPLRAQCKSFILQHFDAVTKTPAFEEVGRLNVDLVFELLQSR